MNLYLQDSYSYPKRKHRNVLNVSRFVGDIFCEIISKKYDARPKKRTTSFTISYALYRNANQFPGEVTESRTNVSFAVSGHRFLDNEISHEVYRQLLEIICQPLLISQDIYIFFNNSLLTLHTVHM